MTKLTLLVALALSLGTLGYVYSRSVDRSPNDITITEAAQEALRQAKEYAPNGLCADVITPAIHKATGVQYEFPSSCIPDGWNPAR